MSLNSTKNLFFHLTLIHIKIKLKVTVFSKIIKSKIFSISSFWKSLSRFSANLSSFYPIWLSTLKKTRNKFFIKLFIKNLFFSNFWISFSVMDAVNSSERTTSYLTNKLNLTDKNNFSLFLTNKNINRIFTTIFLKKQNSNSNFFLEKYFKKEKYSWAVSFSNTLKFYFFKFFTFFLASKVELKKFFLLNYFNFKTNYFLIFQTFQTFFKNTWIFIFYKKNDFTFDKVFSKIQTFSTIFKLHTYFIFFNGFLFTDLDNFDLSKITLFLDKSSVDNNFIWVFLKSNLLGCAKKTVFNLNKVILQKKTIDVFNFFLNSQFYLNKVFFFFFLLKLVNFFFLLKLVNFNVFLKCQLLDN